MRFAVHAGMSTRTSTEIARIAAGLRERWVIPDMVGFFSRKPKQGMQSAGRERRERHVQELTQPEAPTGFQKVQHSPL